MPQCSLNHRVFADGNDTTRHLMNVMLPGKPRFNWEPIRGFGSESESNIDVTVAMIINDG